MLPRPFETAGSAHRTKALVHHGARDVSISEALTSTDICGSELHTYEGRTDMEGRVLGHEDVGEVVAVGDGVDVLAEGDLVVLPFDDPRASSADPASIGAPARRAVPSEDGRCVRRR